MTSFEQHVYQTWAAYFGVDLSHTQQLGTTLIPCPDYPDEKALQFWQIGQQTYLEADPLWLPRLQELLARYRHPHNLTMGEVAAAFALPPSALETRRYFFLVPAEFKPYHPSAEYQVREMTLADQAEYDGLMAVCDPAEVAEVDMSLADEIAYGCYHDGQLVAAASMSDFRGFCDVGVMTHPQWRGRGLGKAVVSPVCDWVLARQRIMLYIVNVNFRESTRLAQSLGFRWFILNENIRP